MSTAVRGEIDLGLERITKLLESLGGPHLRYPVVHIAGTNGKGSVSAFIGHSLSSKYRVGRFNSPHLLHPRDCIRVCEREISMDTYSRTKQRVERANVFSCTTFEILTAVAFVVFAEEGVEIAVVECGMGGLLDATNVATNKILSVVTSLGLDHQQFLGRDVREIARHKAGIIVANVPTVVSAQNYSEAMDVCRERAVHVDSCLLEAAPVICQGERCIHTESGIAFKIPLRGPFQLVNAGTAIEALILLRERGFKLSDREIERGMEGTSWPGRLETLELDGRSILADGAHNVDAAVQVRQHIDSVHPGQPLCFIIAITKGRDIPGMLNALVRASDRIIFTQFTQPIDMPWIEPYPLQVLVEHAKAFFCCSVAADIHEALAMVGSEPVVVCGSIYLLGDLYRLRQRSE